MPRNAEGPWQCERWPVGCPLGRALQGKRGLQSPFLPVTAKVGGLQKKGAKPGRPWWRSARQQVVLLLGRDMVCGVRGEAWRACLWAPAEDTEGRTALQS